MRKFSFAFFDNLKFLLDENFIVLTEKDQENMIAIYGYPAYWPTTCLAYYPNKEQIEIFFQSQHLIYINIQKLLDFLYTTRTNTFYEIIRSIAEQRKCYQ